MWPGGGQVGEKFPHHPPSSSLADFSRRLLVGALPPGPGGGGGADLGSLVGGDPFHLADPVDLSDPCLASLVHLMDISCETLILRYFPCVRVSVC